MAQRVAGTLFVKFDGNQFDVAVEGVEAPIAETSKEAVMSVTGLAGYKETALRQSLKFTAVFTPDFPIASLRNLTNGVLTVECANNRVFTLSGAYLEGETTIDAMEGKIQMEFSGTSGSWT